MKNNKYGDIKKIAVNITIFYKHTKISITTVTSLAYVIKNIRFSIVFFYDINTMDQSGR
jgi:hypothetical protein